MAIEELLQAAVAAPSLHNTQPWRMRIKAAGTRIELFADAARIWLPTPNANCVRIRLSGRSWRALGRP